MSRKAPLRIGFLINPFAGIGGEAALKGSDGDEIRSQALAYSASLRAPQRARRFLQALELPDQADWLTGAGVMGQQLMQEAGIVPRASFGADHPQTSAADTAALVDAFLAENVELIIFVGGDGTARDVLDQLEGSVPCLGIPSGVKMQSGVFALSPEAGAEIVNGLLQTELITLAEQDVRDIDEAALRQGRVRSRYYGSMQVPAEPRFLQRLKQSGIEDETLVLDDIAEHLTELMHDDEKLMVIGPGGTTAHFMQQLGLDNTLIGFDAIQAGELVASDLNAEQLLALQAEYPSLQLVISPTGNQGVLIGRGNQQLTPAFLRGLDKAQWCIVSARSKLLHLDGHPLIVDSNDPELDQALCGLYPVITAYQDCVLYPVSTSY